MVVTDLTFITTKVDENISIESGAALTVTGIVNGSIEL